MGDVFEQLLLGPLGPEQLTLLMAAWAQAPELAGEGDQELMAAVRAAHPGDTVVENPAVEVAVDRRLHAAAQVAVSCLEAFLVDEQEALEVVGQGPIEHRALGMARAMDPGTRRGCCRLHSKEGRRNRA